MDEPRWLTDAEASAWRGYRRMRGLLDLAIARDLGRDSGLSGPDYEVLAVLSGTVGHRRRLCELATLMSWSKSRLSHQITRMRRRGLVAREGCASDARGAFVAMTDQGSAAIEAAAPAHVESVRRHFVDLLSPGQIAALDEITATVLGHLTETSPGPT